MQTRRAHSILITEAHNVMMLLSYRRLNQTPRPQYFGQLYVSKITCNEYTYPPPKTSTKYWVKFPSMLFWDHFLPLIIGGAPHAPKSAYTSQQPMAELTVGQIDPKSTICQSTRLTLRRRERRAQGRSHKKISGIWHGFTLIFSLF